MVSYSDLRAKTAVLVSMDLHTPCLQKIKPYIAHIKDSFTGATKTKTLRLKSRPRFENEDPKTVSRSIAGKQLDLVQITFIK